MHPHRSVKDLVNFPWEEFEKELKDLAPTFWTALKAAATSLDTKYRRKSMPSSVVSTCVVAAAALSKERNIHDSCSTSVDFVTLAR